MEERLRCLRWVHSKPSSAQLARSVPTQRHSRQRVAAQRIDWQIAAVQEGRRFAFVCFAMLKLHA
jgi:hypothetical protein